MNRPYCLVIATVFAVSLGSSAAAQVMVSPKLNKPNRPGQPGPKAWTLHAMDQPDPLFRYRLWPAPEVQQNENPAPLVSRAAMLSLQLPVETRKQFGEKHREWIDMPLDELPADEVRQMLGYHASVLRELGRAENLMRLDYNLQLDQLSAPQTVQTLLPEFQEMRNLGRLLSLRARLAVSEGRWDDMVDDCRLGFRLAEVAGHSTDFLIGRLVGFAISGAMMHVIEEAIQQPGCPNLYWALAGLPENSLFETRDSLEFESVLMARLFDPAASLPGYPIGEVAAREKIRSIVHEANMMMLDGESAMANAEASRLLAGVYVVTFAEPSRELLAATSEWGERAKDLSASEAVLRASKLKFARIRDRWVAWSMLPPEAWNEYEPERKAAFGVDISGTDVMESLVLNLMPAVNAARSAGRRTNQHRNLLLTAEAIRMHGAHEGELPATTQRIRPVPVWSDAMGVKPFGYHRSSPTRATLTRTPRWDADPETTISIELKGKQ